MATDQVATAKAAVVSAAARCPIELNTILYIIKQLSNVAKRIIIAIYIFTHAIFLNLKTLVA